MRFLKLFCAAMAFIITGCVHHATENTSAAEAVRLNPRYVRNAVVYDTGAEEGAVVPELASPQLHAIMVEEHIENGRLIERHREWAVEGDVSILGIPKPSPRHNKSALPLENHK